MSMLKIAKFLHYSNSVDLSNRGDRYLNLSMANSGRLFSCLQSEKYRRNISALCEKPQVSYKED